MFLLSTMIWKFWVTFFFLYDRWLAWTSPVLPPQNCCWRHLTSTVSTNVLQMEWCCLPYRWTSGWFCSVMKLICPTWINTVSKCSHNVLCNWGCLRGVTVLFYFQFFFSDTQRVISFLRQMLEHGGFYRTSDHTWVKFERMQFVGACNPPTDPGRKPLSHR